MKRKLKATFAILSLTALIWTVPVNGHPLLYVIAEKLLDAAVIELIQHVLNEVGQANLEEVKHSAELLFIELKTISVDAPKACAAAHGTYNTDANKLIAQAGRELGEGIQLLESVTWASYCNKIWQEGWLGASEIVCQGMINPKVDNSQNTNKIQQALNLIAEGAKDTQRFGDTACKFPPPPPVPVLCTWHYQCQAICRSISGHGVSMSLGDTAEVPVTKCNGPAPTQDLMKKVCENQSCPGGAPDTIQWNLNFLYADYSQVGAPDSDDWLTEGGYTGGGGDFGPPSGKLDGGP